MAEQIINSTINAWNDAKATEITKELDQKFTQESVTGFLNDNNFGAKFAAAKTVIVRDADVGGLVTYDRDNGFNRGPVTLNKSAYEVKMDRARSLEIDRIDAAETGLDNLAGQMLNVLIKEHAIPEKDAYTLSTLAGIASAGEGQKVTWNPEKPYASLLGAFHKAHAAAGYGEELVAFVSSDVMAALELSPEVSRSITVSDFKQGGVNFKVKSINGVALLPVSPDRMYTAYKFEQPTDDATAEGGFTKDEGAKAIHFIVLPKKAAMGVQKTEKIRMFSPDVNQKADAYKVDYRVMYDVFVKKSKLNTIFAAIAE